MALPDDWAHVRQLRLLAAPHHSRHPFDTHSHVTSAPNVPLNDTIRQSRLRAKAEFDQLLRRHRIEPGELAVKLVVGRLECGRCDLHAEVSTLQAIVHAGEKDPEALAAARLDARRWPCPHCAGTSLGHVEPSLRLQAEREILSRTVPTVRSVEIEGSGEYGVRFVNLSGRSTAELLQDRPDLTAMLDHDDEAERS